MNRQSSEVIVRTRWSVRSHTRTRAIGLGDLLAVGPDVLHRRGSGRPGMPDSASIPDHPSSTARATRPSQSSPAATVTLAPPHWSCGVDDDPARRDLDDRPVEPGIRDDEVGPAAEHEQRLVGVVDLAHRVDQLVGGLGDDHPRGRPADPHRRVRGDRLVEQLLHQSSRTTATQRPRTFSPPQVVVRSTVTRPVSASTALTTP